MIRMTVSGGRPAYRGLRGYGQTPITDLLLAAAEGNRSVLDAAGARARSEADVALAGAAQTATEWAQEYGGYARQAGAVIDAARSGGLSVEDAQNAFRAGMGVLASVGGPVGALVSSIALALEEFMFWLGSKYPASPCYWQDGWPNGVAKALGFESAEKMSGSDNPLIATDVRTRSDYPSAAVYGNEIALFWSRFLHPVETQDPYTPFPATGGARPSPDQQAANRKARETLGKMVSGGESTYSQVLAYCAAMWPQGFDRFRATGGNGGILPVQWGTCWDSIRSQYSIRGTAEALYLQALPQDLLLKLASGALVPEEVVQRIPDRAVVHILAATRAQWGVSDDHADRRPFIGAHGQLLSLARQYISEGKITFQVSPTSRLQQRLPGLPMAKVVQIGGKQYPYTERSRSEGTVRLSIAESVALGAQALVFEGKRYACRCRAEGSGVKCDCG